VVDKMVLGYTKSRAEDQLHICRSTRQMPQSTRVLSYGSLK